MGFFERLLELPLEWAREKRELRKERSRDIYRPIHEQFSRALEEIGDGERPNSLNAKFWSDLKHSGRADAIKPDLRTLLAEIYENFYPRYDSCWMESNGNGLGEFMTGLGEAFGDPREYRPGIKLPAWQRFLTNETFSVSSLHLANVGDVQLWGKCFLDLDKVPSHDLTTFLRECWERADELPVFREVKESRKKLRTGISRVMADIKKNIVN